VRRPTSYPLLCRHALEQSAIAGFTLIEVLAALAVLAATTFVVTSALIAVARAQHLTHALQHGALVIRTAQSRHVVHDYRPQETETLDGWTVRQEERFDEDADGKLHWRLWTLAPTDRPSLRISYGELLGP
jgi:prepilin-type N-terminal cleavage/methylation domain-containing protein